MGSIRNLHILEPMQSVKHFGMFQFKEEVSQDQIAACFLELKSMEKKIPGLLDIHHGPYVGTEDLNEDFSHGFIMTFENEAALEDYLPHPEHERVKSLVVPLLEKLVVFDFLV